MPGNFRHNTFFFSKQIKVAGMLDLHHTSTESLFRFLREKDISVYINLSGSNDFKLAAELAFIQYYCLRTQAYPNLIPVFEEIHSLVKTATLFGKQVVISSRTGVETDTALAALKVRELLECRERTEGNMDANECILMGTSLIQCTPLVKRAVELIRNEQVIDSDERLGKGILSPEIDVSSLMKYEQHLRERSIHLKTFGDNRLAPTLFAGLNPMDRYQGIFGISAFSGHILAPYSWPNPMKNGYKDIFNVKAFSDHIFGLYLFAGPNPMNNGYKDISKNLSRLYKEGITKIYSLESLDSDVISTKWPKFGSQCQHITGDCQTNYFIPDFKAPSLVQMDRIATSILTSIARNEKIYLHCMSGKGRTGTVLAGIYMKKTGLSAKEAISFVRANYDSYAVEMEEQELSLKNYQAYLNKNHQKSFPLADGNTCPPVLQDRSSPSMAGSKAGNKADKLPLRFVDNDSTRHTTLAVNPVDKPQAVMNCQQTQPTETDLQEIHRTPFAKELFGPYCLVDRCPQLTPYDEAHAWSPLENSKLIAIKEPCVDHSGNSGLALDLITNKILELINNKELLYVHCKRNIGETGTVLAAVYMKKTGVSAEEAIDFVRAQYNLSAVETKEQVETLMRYERFLNTRTLEEEIQLRIKKLQDQISTLPKSVQGKAGLVLGYLSDNSIPKEIVYAALVQTSLLLRPEKATVNWINRYRQLTTRIHNHPKAACKELGLAMAALASIAAAVLIGFVSIGTIGLVPFFAGLGCTAITFFSSQKLYSIGQRTQIIATTMYDLYANYAIPKAYF